MRKQDGSFWGSEVDRSYLRLETAHLGRAVNPERGKWFWWHCLSYRTKTFWSSFLVLRFQLQWPINPCPLFFFCLLNPDWLGYSLAHSHGPNQVTWHLRFWAWLSYFWGESCNQLVPVTAWIWLKTVKRNMEKNSSSLCSTIYNITTTWIVDACREVILGHTQWLEKNMYSTGKCEIRLNHLNITDTGQICFCNYQPFFLHAIPKWLSMRQILLRRIALEISLNTKK